MSYTFTTQVKLRVYGLGIKRNHQNTAVLKTVMKIILRNDCKNGHFAARVGSYLEFSGTVLVTCFLHLLSFCAKGSGTSLLLFHTKMGLKQVTFIITETILRQVLFCQAY